MSTKTLRPNGTLAAVNYSTTGGTVDAVTSDSNNATYVSLLGSDSYAALSLGTFTLGTGETVKKYRICVKANAPTPPFSSMSALLLNGYVGDLSTAIHPTQMTSGLASAIMSDYFGPWVEGYLSQSRIDALVADIFLYPYVSGTFPVRFAEVYAEVVVAEVPTVTATAPTGAQGTPRPTVSWTFTEGTDAGPQAWAQVKIFSAAQYGAGGFNPATSTATYDSGEIAQSSTSHTITESLANSGTFRAYVRAAHEISEWKGWSAWSYIGFTTSYTTADVSTVTAVPTNASGLFTITVARNTGTHAWTTVDIERTDDSGGTWVPVRGGTATTATNTWVTTWGADTVVIVDYEVANGRTVSYRARGNWVNSGVPVPGPWTVSGAGEWESTSTIIKDPLRPTRNYSFRLHAMPNGTRRRPQGVFDVVGRTDVVAVTDVRRTAEGVFEIHTPNETAAAALVALGDSVIWLIHAPASHRMPEYVVVGDIDERRAVRTAQDQHRYWSVPYVSAAKPEDDTA